MHEMTKILIDRCTVEQALKALKMMGEKYGEYACPACDHADAAIDALRERLAQPEQEPVDVGRLEYFGDSVAYIHQKMTAYRNAIDDAWAALWFKGIHHDANTSVADAIKEYVAPLKGEA